MPDHNLGDLSNKLVDPLDVYYDIYRQGVRLPRRKWIVQPEWQPAEISGMEKISQVIERHLLPRFWQLLADFHLQMQTGQYFIKKPNWLEPPRTARNLDIRTETPVVLGAGSTDVVILTFTIPDRWYGTILKLGHELTDATFWGTVTWTIRVANRPVENYQAFKQQIGMFVDPTAVPIFPELKTGDVVEWIASNPGGAPVSALARIWGFMFPAKMVTQDGTFRQYETK